MTIEELENKNHEGYILREKKYARKITEILKNALAGIRAEMSKLYEKYAINGILTKAEMTKYNRLASLEKNVLNILTPAIKETIRMVDRIKPKEYGEGFFRSGWAIDNGNSVELSWGPLNKPAIIENLDNTFFDTATKRYSLKQLGSIRNVISQGILNGHAYPQMIKELKNVLNIANWEILRILRTEMGAAYSAGSSHAYQSAINQGIKGRIIWDAALDGRTRPTHAEMDGKARNDDGYFYGSVGKTPYPRWEGMVAGERINCRCSIRFEADGYEPGLRRIKGEGIMPYQSYDTWVENKKYWK